MSLTKILMKKMLGMLKRDDRALRPSKIGGCPRAVVLEHLYPTPEEDKEEVDESLLFKWGSALGGVIYERAIAPLLKSEGFLYQVRVRMDDIEGTCDFYKYDPNTEEGVVLDLKTINRATLPYIPSEAHIDQITVYMDCILHGEVWTTEIVEKDGVKTEVEVARLPNPKKVRGCLIYLLRENPLYLKEGQECWIDYDEVRAKNIRERFKWLKESIEKGEIPPVPRGYTPFKYPCYIPSYEGVYTCPFWEKCWRETITPEDADTSPELIDLARKYYNAWFCQQLYSKEREKYSQMLNELTKGIPTLTIPFEGGILKKSIVSYDDIDYHQVLLGLLSYINEEFKLTLPQRKKIAEVIENLKKKHRKVITYTRYIVSSGRDRKGSGQSS